MKPQKLKSDASPWLIMGTILNNKVPTEEQIKTINSFFFCRWMSNERKTIPIAAMINRYYNIPILAQYKFANVYVQRSEASRIKYIDYSKIKVPEMKQKILNNIQKYYNVSEQIAEEYFKMMMQNPSELDRLMDMYEHGLQK